MLDPRTQKAGETLTFRSCFLQTSTQLQFSVIAGEGNAKEREQEGGSDNELLDGRVLFHILNP